MQFSRSTALTPARTRYFVAETAVLLAVSAGLPILIHLIPAASVPWGARLLPLFYAPLIGVGLYRLHAGLIPALIAPVLNYFMLGSPAPHLLGILTIELVLFTVIAFAVLRRFQFAWFVGPLAYVGTKAMSGILVGTIPWFDTLRPAGSFVAISLKTAIPGLLMLTALSLLIVQIRRARKQEPS